MSREDETRHRDANASHPVIVSSCLLLSLSLLLAGCSSTGPKQAATNEDPLVGGKPIPPVTPATGGPAPAGLARGTVPPIPVAQGPFNTAALATGNVGAADNNADLRGLRIPNTGPAGQFSTVGGSSGPQGPVVLQGPQPVPGGSPQVTPAVQVTLPGPTVQPPQAFSPPPGTSPAGKTIEEALLPLKARGLAFAQLTWDDQGLCKFNCRIPDKQNPRLGKNYEAKDRDPVAAIQSVVDQVDKSK